MLVAVADGLPAGLRLDEETIARDLARRRQGAGRGARMSIESDRPRLVAGVRHGRTLGSPIAILLENRDFENWRTRMKPGPLAEGEPAGEPVTLPRPGHADLAAAVKYGASDLRDVMERASARETAARTALGAVARALLRSADVAVGSAVRSIADARAPAAIDCVPEAAVDADALSARADGSPVRAVDARTEGEMLRNIEEAAARRTTVGGVFEVVATGVPPGLGSPSEADGRLGARLLAALAGIPAVKGAECGDGFAAAQLQGIAADDAIVRAGPALRRRSNHAGGVEGGLSNGEPIVLRAAMKPLPTQGAPLESVDLATGDPGRAHVERSDTCAVPAAAVVGEAVVALCLAEALLDGMAGDTVAELRARVRSAWRRTRRLPSHLYLSGPSGAGKSTVGAVLARSLGLPFVDLDAEIERESGCPIGILFENGESAFRARELAALQRAAAGPRSVVALGGGTETRRAARDVLRRSGDVVRLAAPVPVLVARLRDGPMRPLLAGDPGKALERLESERADARDLAADALVDADGTVDATVQRVLGALR